jgi:hypothetical protein
MDNENVPEQKPAAPPAQTLTGNAPIASEEKVLQQEPDDNRPAGDRQR